ncbi:Brp/Blh family beta-carotene 15,15'-dioxygenase [Deinococcus ruber]|uniref:Probable beta-carotene 15,15'-dioxygenase n=1 Tax=Deinococcus ruber TaxID=1848197 RepID=A0A918CDX9_9DEIO|nr:Brp/Blh family beta-carotene 15,15'-dioxygenase [Deinococcus ruber]GGR19337.1 beta-carotene 15,15'-dioxygenase [Deinococcus ruber]
MKATPSLPGRPPLGTFPLRLKAAEGVPVVSLLLLLVVWNVAPGVLERAVYVPLLVSTVLFGIPHGALDHRLPIRLGWGWAQTAWGIGGYITAYALGAALTFSVWWLAPHVIFWGFLLLSLLHWGQGDLYHLEVFQGRRRAGFWSAPLTLLTRGSLPILLPLLVFPDWFARLAAGIDRVVGRSGPVGPLLPPGVGLGLTAVFLGLLIAYVWDVLVSSRRPALELTETGVLLLVFSLVPAPLSIGAYFSMWHAWRHLQRLLDMPDTRKARGTSRVLRLVAELLPITVVALGLLLAVACWAAPRLLSVETFTALYLALIAALTVPHAVLVACMGLSRTTVPRSD